LVLIHLENSGEKLRQPIWGLHGDSASLPGTRFADGRDAAFSP
jgi:hypothetical protein